MTCPLDLQLFLRSIVEETQPAGGSMRERLEDAEGQLAILRDKAASLLEKHGRKVCDRCQQSKRALYSCRGCGITCCAHYSANKVGQKATCSRCRLG